jgi:hypothetical protein
MDTRFHANCVSRVGTTDKLARTSILVLVALTVFWVTTVATKRCIKKAILVTLIATAAWVISCATGTRGTQLMYHTDDGKRLPFEKVAQILMHDMIGFGNSLEVSFDSFDPINVKDTLEIRPGRHIMYLRVQYNSNPKKGSWMGTPPGKGGNACLYFEFVAEARHQYSFVLVEFKLSSWQVDLVDNTSPSPIVHGIFCG